MENVTFSWQNEYPPNKQIEQKCPPKIPISKNNFILKILEIICSGEVSHNELNIAAHWFLEFICWDGRNYRRPQWRKVAQSFRIICFQQRRGVRWGLWLRDGLRDGFGMALERYHLSLRSWQTFFFYNIKNIALKYAA